MATESTPEMSRRGGKGKPAKGLPKPSGLTLKELISKVQRPEQKPGLRAREIALATHTSAETFRSAIDNPERLSLASIHGLAVLMGVDFMQLVADISHQVSLKAASGFDTTPAGGAPRVYRRRPAATIKVAVDATGNSEHLAEREEQKASAANVHADQVEDLPARFLDEKDELEFPVAAVEASQIRYADATLAQRTLALASVQQELKHHFPDLNWLKWAAVMDALQPDLWLEGEIVAIAYEDLTRLTQRLAWAVVGERKVSLDPPIYCMQAFTLARRLSQLAYHAVLALAEMEQDPTAYGLYTRGIILKLASGNTTAEQVLQAMSDYHFKGNGFNKMVPIDQMPGSPEVQDRIFDLTQYKAS
ncbi:hypothetical protein J7E24_09155 [Hymenobacter sp. ISL-91]|uniref:hypothetical protein n=1 Tax=Hymenobacter sp. ISL-91 TaxID=2819151 RepID=UPI001BE7B8D9|nr:hypothetical protein [Hymenobacter sp. ISL-91]MBT2557950.1 hypothetical protein [Hymenobacter sp. ISL-91]